MSKVVEKKVKKVLKPAKAALAHPSGKEKAKKVAPVHVDVEVSPKELEEELKPTEIEVEATADEKAGKKERYYEAIGRRKESVAIVRLYTKKSTDTIEGDYALIVVNNKDYRDYFTDKTLQSIVESALRKLKSTNRFKATVKVNGGGLSGQAGAIKHGIARTLILFDLNFRKKLKKSGFLTRDPREKERRKYGLKKARKAPGWSKR